MTTNITDQYKILDEIQHIRQRTGMYAGSTALEEHEESVLDPTTGKMQDATIKYIPALVKIFSEILDNSIDEHRRAPKQLDTIKVEVKDNTVSVFDNGRGIPVKVHPQTGKYVAETVFSNLRAGSNFDDATDQQLIGTNGVGSTLTNVLSTKFMIESADGEQVFKQTFKDGMRTRGEPTILPSDKRYTKITFTPDLEFFKLDKLDDDHVAKIFRRILDAAACNNAIKFYFNGTRVPVTSFQDYAKLYVADVLYEESDTWQVAIGKATNFSWKSFVNSVETYMGGTHVDYVVDPIVEKVRAFIKKKHKIDVRPSDVKSKLYVFINANINRPKFSSQTKERLISPASEYKTAWAPSDKLINKLLKSDIIESIVIWAEAKQKAQEEEDRRKLDKSIDKANPRRILKLEDASLAGKKPEECYLFIAEGDSAAKAIVSGRNPKNMGALALRGKPQNANSISLDKLLGIDGKKEKDDKKKADQTEFVNIMVAMGLQMGVKVTDIKQLRYSKLVITADADHDGHHISGLMVSNLSKFWPELFNLGVVYRFFTPLIKVWLKGKKKETMSFETDVEYRAWVAITGNAEKVKAFKYFKGLGTSEAKDFKEYLADVNSHLVKISLDEAKDMELINLVFGKEDGSSDLRKEWLDISEDPIFGDDA